MYQWRVRVGGVILGAVVLGSALAPAARAGESSPRAIGSGATGRFAVTAVAHGAPGTGEGILTITMAGPGTSWADAANTAVVVEATVDGGQWQTFVLFAGATPFSYSGFTGPLTTGHHVVAVHVDSALSHVTDPVAVVSDVELGVVLPGDPEYVALANAPVMYERSYGATGDTPLVQWVSTSADGAGGTDLAYQTVWTHEDIGDSVVPANEWGKWGRMSDIDPTIRLTVTRDPRTNGFVTKSATMDGCSFCPPSAPATITDHLTGDDADVAFHGGYFGTASIDHHPIIRVFTGNGDVTDQGTSPFRFQQVLVAPPGPGQTREAVMDAHPWTYRIMAQEVDREYAQQYSTDPRAILPGDTRQYAIVDLDVTPSPATGPTASGQSSIAVELTLTGDPTVYSNDYRQAGAPTAYPFYVGGHARTVVKLPLGWQSHAISGVNLRLDYPPGSAQAATATVHSLSVISLTSAYDPVAVATPAPTFSTFPELVPARP